MRTSHEQRLDKALFLEGLAEQKPEDSASKWFRHKAYDVGKKEGDLDGLSKTKE